MTGSVSLDCAPGFRVACFGTREEMGEAAAGDVAKYLREILAKQVSVRMVFAAAPSQGEMLAALENAGGIEWSRVTAFHMDEYIGLPDEHPSGFATWLQQRFFGRVPFGEVFLLRPGNDPEAAAQRYASALAEAPIDVVCLGIGDNGHIAFNDPPVADFDDPLDVKVVELDPGCRQQQVDDGCFPTLSDVPTKALTLTVPRLLNAARLFAVVPGKRKREAVRNALYGCVSTTCPASILRTHSACTLYLDGEADPDGQD